MWWSYHNPLLLLACRGVFGMVGNKKKGKEVSFVRISDSAASKRKKSVCEIDNNLFGGQMLMISWQEGEGNKRNRGNILHVFLLLTVPQHMRRDRKPEKIPTKISKRFNCLPKSSINLYNFSVNRTRSNRWQRFQYSLYVRSISFLLSIKCQYSVEVNIIHRSLYRSRC